MKSHVLSFRMRGLVTLASFFLAGVAAAQNDITPGSERPLFTRMSPTLHSPRDIVEASASPLQTWYGSFTYRGKAYTYNMVGGGPSWPSSNNATTITTYLIPVKIVLSDGATYDPNTTLSNGSTVTNNTVASPIFTSNVDFTSGGTASVDMGITQYVDAFQRANFWGTVQDNMNSHLLLGLKTLPEQTLNVPSNYGTQAFVFGFDAGLVDINWFDSQAHALLTSLGITPDTFAIFLTYDVYLTQRHQCCIGGYHSSTGSTNAAQSYAEATYVDVVGAFSQDVSALSHEVGEWADDPLVNNSGNPTPCHGVLEVGDPLEKNPNYGSHPYTGGNGFTYNLQDLATLPYFGAPPSTSVNREFSFQDESLTVCQNGS